MLQEIAAVGSWHCSLHLTLNLVMMRHTWAVRRLAQLLRPPDGIAEGMWDAVGAAATVWAGAWVVHVPGQREGVLAWSGMDWLLQPQAAGQQAGTDHQMASWDESCRHEGAAVVAAVLLGQLMG